MTVNISISSPDTNLIIFTEAELIEHDRIVRREILDGKGSNFTTDELRALVKIVGYWFTAKNVSTELANRLIVKWLEGNCKYPSNPWEHDTHANPLDGTRIKKD
jgi:hypothetical protein